MSQLPQEILDLFIDHFADSPAELKALSLVAKSWLPRTRKHLFRRLHIAPLPSYSSSKGEQDYADRMAALAEAFEGFLHTPEIVRCIKVVIMGRHGSGMFRLLKQRRDSKSLLHRMASALKGRLQVLTSNYDGPCIEPTLNAHICALFALPSNRIEFLSYDLNVDRLRSQSSLANFSDILQSSRLWLKHLSLQNVDIIPSTGSTCLDLLECIAAYAPSLETLCLSVRLYVAIYNDLDVATFRQNAQKPGTHGLIAPIAMSRFCLQNGCPSHILEIVLFENNHLTFKNLVYLTIEHVLISVFDKPSCLQNLKHLTLYEHLGECFCDLSEYNAVQFHHLSLPSLTHLQLFVSHLQSMIVILCRAVLGPSKATKTSYDRMRELLEYPKNDSVHLPAQTVEHGLHLHIQLLEGGLWPTSYCPSIDAILHSYLNIGPSELCGPVERITINRNDDLAQEYWPLTWRTGRIGPGEADFWWDRERW
ncbi:hypothetical protein BT96DRAFT_1026667 [Gymnopus androsaceus JB14]|uniref:Uncharacterized protein n=1 Tax=Gymnopus androsaceus JB14 TaxID=1447944 RepID=A0A6A4GI59_9AGAR|nr:hypothetical protein BT96DRAFT_1026667 [Gymnopus androsaceus JB14]